MNGHLARLLVRTAVTLVAAGVIFQPLGASAVPVTYYFTGTVDVVPGALTDFFSAGAALTGFYTFESTTPDGSSDPRLGEYPGAIVGLGFTVGSYAASFAAGGNSLDITRREETPWEYGIDVRFTGASLDAFAPRNFGFSLLDEDQVVPTSDALTSTPPPLGAFESKRFSVGFTGSELVFVRGELTSLSSAIPAPATLFLTAAGVGALAAACGWGRRTPS